jgi:hypothetical protein
MRLRSILLTLLALSAILAWSGADAVNVHVGTGRALLRGKTAAGVVPIAPNKVASSVLKEWFKADAGTFSDAGCTTPQTTNNGAIGCWADQSGNGNNAIKCAAGPTYVVATPPALQFLDTSSQCLTTTYAGAAGTIIAVYYNATVNNQENVGTQDNALISGAPQAGATITAYDIYVDTPINSTTNTFHASLFSYGTTSSSSAYTWTLRPSRKRLVEQISGMTNDGSTLTAYDYGSIVGTAAIPGGATVYTATGQVIGAGDFNNVHGSYFRGTIAEIIVFQGKISASDYAGVVLYEQQKYGLVPSGNYLMVAGNVGPAPVSDGYTDNNLYMLQGPDGVSFPSILPSNYVPTVLSSQTKTLSLAPQILHDMNGNLVKYNGRYWVEDSRCPYNNGIAYPCVTVDILTSLPDPVSGLPVNWTLSSTINCDLVLDGVSTTRGCFNDGWVIDVADNSVHALFNASNKESTLANVQSYVAPITLNADGTSSAGTIVAFGGTGLPFGSATASTGFYVESVVKLGSIYYAFFDNLTNFACCQIQWLSSSSPFTGYNGTSASISGMPSEAEWPNWIQSGGGNGTLYFDDRLSSGQSLIYGHTIAADNAFGTVSGVTNAATMTFPGQFFPQQASIVKLPAVNLP